MARWKVTREDPLLDALDTAETFLYVTIRQCDTDSPSAQTLRREINSIRVGLEPGQRALTLAEVRFIIESVQPLVAALERMLTNRGARRGRRWPNRKRAA